MSHRALDRPSGYIWRSHEDLIRNLPDLDFEPELRNFLGMSPHLPAWWKERRTDRIALERKEVGEALLDRGVNRAIWADTVGAYEELWKLLPREEFNGRNYNWDWYETRHTLITLAESPADADAPDIDFSALEPRLTFLPREFMLYIKGAAAYRQKKFRQAIVHWESLLRLPPEERVYRSVWAAFMLGKAWLHLDTQKSIAQFEACRILAEAGFRDPLRLRTASLGWQADAELTLGNEVRAIRLYAEQHKLGSDYEQGMSFQSFYYALHAVFQDGSPPDEALHDPLVREIITLWLLSHRGGERSYHSWAVALESRLPEEAEKMPGRMAQLFYLAREFDNAQFWSRQGEEDDFYCRWVEAKIRMQRPDDYSLETEYQYLITLYRNLVKKGDPLLLRYPDIENALLNEQAVTSYTQGGYAAALELFVEAKNYRDAAYIGECVLTTDELSSVVDNLPLSVGGRERYHLEGRGEFSIYARLNEILARKLAREGKLDAAFRRVPSIYYLIYKDALTQGHDARRAKVERARDLFLAGRIMRENGRKCFGTHYAPDWIGSGWRVPTGQDRIQAGVARPVETMRINSNRPTPNRRQHYRWKAADLMWECAQLLPNNDELLAQALWYGGTYIAIEDPEGADKFYKALVRRCGKLPIGREADTRRWFPLKPPEWPYPADRTWSQ